MMQTMRDKATTRVFERTIDKLRSMNKIPESGIVKYGKESVNTNLSFAEQSQATRSKLEKLTFKNKSDFGKNLAEDYDKYMMLDKLKMGLCIAGVVLAVADIVVTSITLYNYYNRDHIDIPNIMVDMSYNDKKQTSFVNYEIVRDNKDKQADLLGGTGKQWLALYQTHDTNAGWRRWITAAAISRCKMGRLRPRKETIIHRFICSGHRVWR